MWLDPGDMNEWNKLGAKHLNNLDILRVISKEILFFNNGQFWMWEPFQI